MPQNSQETTNPVPGFTTRRMRLLDPSLNYSIMKAGVLPFMPETPEWRVKVMLPIGKLQGKGAPMYQLAKGTRRYRMENEAEWHDLPKSPRELALDLEHQPFTLEPLRITALREAAEEIGLREDNIEGLYDMGCHHVRSVQREALNPIQLFGAEVKDMRHFDVPASSTADIAWMTMEEFAEKGRPDHVVAAEQMLRLIAKLPRFAETPYVTPEKVKALFKVNAFPDCREAMER